MYRYIYVILLFAFFNSELKASELTKVKESARTKKLSIEKHGVIDENIDNEIGLLAYPTQITFDDKDNLYILDYSDKLLKKYALSGKFIKAIGASGQGPGEFRNLSTIGYFDNQLYTYDSQNRRITIFDTNGNFKKDFSLHTYFKGWLKFQQFLKFSDKSVFLVRPISDYSAQISQSVIIETNSDFASFTELIKVSVPMQGHVVGGSRGGFEYYHNNIIATSWGEFWVTPHTEYEIKCYSIDGKEIRTIRQDALKNQYTDKERKNARNSWVILNGKRFTQELPEYKQDIEALTPDQEDQIWVLTSTRGKNGELYFDVYGKNGERKLRVEAVLGRPHKIYFHKKFLIVLHSDEPKVTIFTYKIA